MTTYTIKSAPVVVTDERPTGQLRWLRVEDDQLMQWNLQQEWIITTWLESPMLTTTRREWRDVSMVVETGK